MPAGRRPPTVFPRDSYPVYFVPGLMHGQVHSGDVVEDVWQPPGLPRLSISSTSRSKLTGFFSVFMGFLHWFQKC